MMNIRHEEPVFSWYLESQKKYSRAFIIDLFLTLNKYFKGFGVYSYDEKKFNFNECWEDLILDDKIIIKNYPVECEINLKFFILVEELIETIEIERSLRFFFGEHNGKFYLNLDMYANVFTDKNFIFSDGKISQIDQSLAAIKNRKTLTGFLSNLAKNLYSSKIEVNSDYIELKYLSEHGINQNAILIHI